MPSRQFAGTLIRLHCRLDNFSTAKHTSQSSLIHASYATKTSTSVDNATREPASERPVPEESVRRKDHNHRKGPFEAPNPSVWKRLLRTKRLGEDSSVIVLRDAEGNHVKRQAVTSSGNESHDRRATITADDLIDIVNKSNSLPEQDDVNRRIEELRPKTLHHDSDGCPVTSRSNYEQAALGLHAEFNAQQLSRYATKYASASIMKCTRQDPQPRMKSPARRHHKRISRSKWKRLLPEIDNVESIKATDSQSTTRSNALAPFYKSRKGKMGPVQAILVRVWNFRIAEESHGKGTIRLQLDSGLVDFLLVGGMSNSRGKKLTFTPTNMPMLDIRVCANAYTGAKSSLHVLGKTFSVGVARGLDGSIVITGTKDSCEMAADRVDSLVQNRAVTVLDLTAFWKCGLSSAGKARILDLAARYRCTVAIDAFTKRMTVNSISREDQQLFQRQLVSSCDLPPQSKEKLITSIEPATSGIVCHSSTPNSQYAFSAHAEEYGRFTTPLAIADRTPEHSRISSVVRISTDTMRDAVSFLDQDDVEQCEPSLSIKESHSGAVNSGANTSRQSEWSIASTRYQADFGHILHYIHKGTYDYTTCDALLHSAETHHFSNEFQGLRQFLFSSLSKTRHEIQDVLSLQLIPSPWRGSAKNKYQPPNLEMKLILDPETQNVRLKHLTAQSPNAQAFLLLPDHVVDLRVTRSTCQSFRNIDQDPSVKEFVQSINDSAAGYGQITPPSSLMISIPSSDDKSSRSAMGNQKKLVEYVVKSLSFDQTLRFHYDAAFRLIYRRTSANMAAETSESMSLHWRRMPDGTATDGHEHTTSDFLSSAAEIARRLTRSSVIPNIAPRSLAPLQEQAQTSENIRQAAVG